MRNEKVMSEELCKALRCSATPFEKCTGCPYDSTESLEDFKERFPDDNIIPPEADCDGMYHFCDVDRIALDAAERIEELEKDSERACELIYSLGVERSKLEKRVQALVHEIQFTPLISALCRYCKYEERELGEDPCENCEGLHFEWKE